MKLNKVEPKYILKSNPRIGLITLGSDFRIEKDFNNVIHGRDVDIYIRRIIISLFENYLVFFCVSLHNTSTVRNKNYWEQIILR